MADKDKKLTAEEWAAEKKAEKARAADDAVAQARKDQEAIDKAVADAVYNVTHDKDGDPVPLVAKES
jgi:hypothetical protein